MDVLDAREVTRLADQRGGTRVSLFLRTHPGGPHSARNRRRLESLLQHAQHALRTDGTRAGEVATLLGPARQLLDLTSFWARPSDGLALFLGPDGPRRFRVPLSVPELVTVGDRFVVRPLLPLLAVGSHFYVLTLTPDEIRLFQGTRFAVDEMTLDGSPFAMWLTMPRCQPPAYTFLAEHGGAGGRAVFHSVDDYAKPLVQHFQRVDQALREFLGGVQAPLVLTGVSYLQALYRQANTHPQLLSTGVDRSPAQMSPEQRHQQVWPLVEPVLRSQEEIAVTAYRQLRGTGRTSVDPAEVLSAAQQGRVEILFLSTGVPGWRTGVGAGPLVRLWDLPGPSEQLDMAAVATLRHAGNVHVVPASRMPDIRPVAAAATLRH